MDLLKIIIALKAERQRLDEAITALERLRMRNTRRRGRPPKWLKGEIQGRVGGRFEKDDENSSKRHRKVRSPAMNLRYLRKCSPFAVHIADLSTSEVWASETRLRRCCIGYFCRIDALFAGGTSSCFDGLLL
jgi:hypothetical protein